MDAMVGKGGGMLPVSDSGSGTVGTVSTMGIWDWHKKGSQAKKAATQTSKDEFRRLGLVKNKNAQREKSHPLKLSEVCKDQLGKALFVDRSGKPIDLIGNLSYPVQFKQLQDWLTQWATSRVAAGLEVLPLDNDLVGLDLSKEEAWERGMISVPPAPAPMSLNGQPAPLHAEVYRKRLLEFFNDNNEWERRVRAHYSRVTAGSSANATPSSAAAIPSSTTATPSTTPSSSSSSSGDGGRVYHPHRE